MNEDKYGVLENSEIRPLFEKINLRPYCSECKLSRNDFAKDDKSEVNGFYSNLLPGFSSQKVTLPLQLLIIGDSHGGRGKEKLFREINKPLDEEVKEFAGYYLFEKLEKFHQNEMRILFNWCDENNFQWVFTDLIKSYATNKGNNMKLAQSHCIKYLEEQINLFKPKITLCLGKRVWEQFSKNKINHGESQFNEMFKSHFIFCYFPASRQADRWVANNGWKPINKKISELIGIKT